MRINGFLRDILLTAFVSVVLAACGGGAGPNNVRVGVAVGSYVHGVVAIAEDNGYFTDAGIETRVQTMGGSSATMKALVSGDIDIGVAGGDSMVKADLAGGGLVVVAGLVDRFYHRLIGNDAVGGLQDARGRSIGLPFLGGPQDTAVKYALASAGISYDHEVSVRNMGADFNRMVALSRGDVDITTASMPVSRLGEWDAHVIADLPEWDVHFPYAVVIVSRERLATRPESVERFLRGYCRGITFYKSPRNRDKSISIIQGWLGLPAGSPTAQVQYAEAGPSFLSNPPLPTREAFQMVLDFIDDPRAAGKRPEEFLNLTILQRLIREGSCGGLA